jgi:hypothetical protein
MLYADCQKQKVGDDNTADKCSRTRRRIFLRQILQRIITCSSWQLQQKIVSDRWIIHMKSRFTDPVTAIAMWNISFPCQKRAFIWLFLTACIRYHSIKIYPDSHPIPAHLQFTYWYVSTDDLDVVNIKNTIVLKYLKYRLFHVIRQS